MIKRNDRQKDLPSSFRVQRIFRGLGQSSGEVLSIPEDDGCVSSSSLTTCMDFNPVFVFASFFGPDVNLLSDTPECPLASAVTGSLK